MSSFDLIVAGGGPAGASAAWRSASAGAKVLVVDKAKFPRDKPCGDGLTPRAVESIGRLGLENELKRYNRVEKLRVNGAGRTLTFDWPKLKVTGTAKEHAVDLALPADAQDPMSLQISSLRDLAAGKLKPTAWMVDTDKLKDYEMRQEGTARIDTELGELDTVIYTSRRPNSDRVTRTWVAPALGYLPVKAERVRGKKLEFTLLIQSVDR